MLLLQLISKLLFSSSVVVVLLVDVLGITISSMFFFEVLFLMVCNGLVLHPLSLFSGSLSSPLLSEEGMLNFEGKPVQQENVPSVFDELSLCIEQVPLNLLLSSILLPSAKTGVNFCWALRG